MENASNKNHNVTSHQINKVEAQKDNIINDYSEQLRNADRLKNLILEAEKIGIIGENEDNLNSQKIKEPINLVDTTI